MRATRFVPFFVFLFFLTGPVLLADKVYAMCCGCTSCWLPWCSCPGQNGCAWYQCRSNESENIQVYSPSEKTVITVKTARNADGMVDLRQGSECSRAKFSRFTLRILGDVAGNLKPVPIEIELREPLPIQVAANMDR
jgi:hypothetical protein